MIGTNEAGKTNLLIALWKLKPAGGGEIDLIADLPRVLYSELRSPSDHERLVFIQADFDLPPPLVSKLRRLTGCPEEELRVARVSRCFSGRYQVGFPCSPSEDRSSQRQA